jgi:hypothetical protein
MWLAHTYEFWSLGPLCVCVCVGGAWCFDYKATSHSSLCWKSNVSENFCVCFISVLYDDGESEDRRNFGAFKLLVILEDSAMSSYSTTNKMYLLSQIICSCKTFYMFRTVFPSIIRSSKLSIQRRFMSYVKEQQVAAAVWHIPLLYTQFWAPDDGRKDLRNM